MKKTIFVVLMLVFLAFGQTVVATDNTGGAQAENSQEMANKKAAMAFFQLIVGDRDYETARKYVAEYIQHDPEVAGDGIDPLIHYLETDPKFRHRPKADIKFYNIIADGDLVSFQNRKELSAEEDGSPVRILVQHSFRFNKDGKIAEHWSASTRVKVNTSRNGHPLW